MSELALSATNWLGISLRNGAAMVFNLDQSKQWQHLKSVTNSEPMSENTTENQQSSSKQEDEEQSGDLNRNLIKFSPNGQRLAINGQNKQIFIYVPSDTNKSNDYWQLSRIIHVKKRASAIDLTNDLLLIADKSGDVYTVDLSLDRGSVEVTLTADDCMMGHLSMLLDVAFIRTQVDQPLILTADRDEKIRSSYYPNAYNIQGFCLGHTEFVSHVKYLHNDQILSASGDGTLRLWQLPDCLPLNVFHSTALISSSKRYFYPTDSNDENAQSSISEKTIDTSIWKMDLVASEEIFIALSIYAHRTRSIYVARFNRKTNSLDEHRQLVFHSRYGSIIDYCFSSSNSGDLFVLFDSNQLVKVNVISMIFNDSNASLDEVNHILHQEEFHPTHPDQSTLTIFKQLFKNRTDPGDSSYYKRKNERLEQAEEKRKRKQHQT